MTNKKTPMRMCIGCREMKPKMQLIRIVRTPQNEIKLDFVGKQNGRGAYLCKDAACLEKAIKTNAVAHAFNTSLPQGLNEQLREEMKQIDR